MKFTFVCPETRQVFESDDFSIIEHQGIKTDEHGHKYLDAKVALNSECPFCGQKHVFHARELTCPFSPGAAD